MVQDRDVVGCCKHGIESPGPVQYCKFHEVFVSRDEIYSMVRSLLVSEGIRLDGEKCEYSVTCLILYVTNFTTPYLA
jgi:hypothetical protein